MKFDRIVATLAALIIIGLVVFLLIRNEPIADGRLFFALRLIMSFGAATLGATLPGFLEVGWKGGGLAIRAGGALALFVLSFVYTPDLVNADEKRSENTEIIGAARDINATTVNITVMKYPYLVDKSLSSGIIREGWFGVHENFSQLVAKDKNSIAIFPTGNVEHHLGFTLASKPGSNIIVDSLSLKLKSFEKCDLRDETTRILGYVGQVNKSYYISDKYDTYPITPLIADLENAKWQYKGGDSDDFRIYIDYAPYIAYFVTVSLGPVGIQRE